MFAYQSTFNLYYTVKSKPLLFVALMSAAILSNTSDLALNQPGQEFTLPIGIGKQIQKNQKYVTSSGSFSLELENDGNFVVRNKNRGYIWGTAEVLGTFDRSVVSSVALLEHGGIGLFDVSGTLLGHIVLPKQNPLRAAVTGNFFELNISSWGSLQLVDTAGVLGSTDENFGPAFYVGAYEAPLTESESELDAEPGWDECWVMTDPSIKIFVTKNVSDEALDAVAGILKIMTKALQPALDPVTKNPSSKFNGFKVYITNEETGAELNKLNTVRQMYKDGNGKDSRNYILGGASKDFLWITEQMICKTGIETRNKLPGADKDTSYRSFDQVVHEFAHSIDIIFDLQKANGNSRVFDGAIGPLEGFAIAVQYWFGVLSPGGTISAQQRTNLSKVFTTQVDFRTEGYGD
jgi:hypothetical protein